MQQVPHKSVKYAYIIIMMWGADNNVRITAVGRAVIRAGPT